MSSLSVLLLATPIFGLSLQPPTIEPIADVGIAPALRGGEMADGGIAPALRGGAMSGFHSLHGLGPAALYALDDEDADASGGSEEGEEGEESDQADSEGGTDDAEQAQYLAEVKERNALAKVHRPLGLATWAAMTVTVALGLIQYYNLYGFFAGQGDNPCVEGDAIFGQEQCAGPPWPHRIGWITTTMLYSAAFTVSLMMPDPDDLSNAKGEFAETVRMHKLLRWVHFSGMLAQIALGLIISTNAFGLDRANDYDTLQTLATVHMATGLVTYGALTWAGALMTF